MEPTICSALRTASHVGRARLVGSADGSVSQEKSIVLATRRIGGSKDTGNSGINRHGHSRYHAARHPGHGLCAFLEGWSGRRAARILVTEACAGKVCPAQQGRKALHVREHSGQIQVVDRDTGRGLALKHGDKRAGAAELITRDTWRG